MVPPKLTPPILCLVTDRSLSGADALLEKIALAVQGGVNMVQVREKDLSDADLLKLAGLIQKRFSQLSSPPSKITTPLFIINDRVDVALACNADGVHLSESGLSTKEARRRLGSKKLIGRSVHSLDSALSAEASGVDYLIVGTIFETHSKAGKRPEGLLLLQEIAQRVGIPCLGIGGINASNINSVSDTGAEGAAVISSILSANDSLKAAFELSQLIDLIPVAH